MASKHERVKAILLQHGKESRRKYNWPWLDGRYLTRRRANKFLLGAIIDFQVPANSAWDTAQNFAETALGDPPLLWQRIRDFTPREWDARFPTYKLHRFRWAHTRVRHIAGRVVGKFGGDFRDAFEGKSARKVLGILETELKVGPAIARMIVGALIDTGHLQGQSDLKPDRHVRRVLGRVYQQSEITARQALTLARQICPNSSWVLDNPLYDIGKRFCKARQPLCANCPLNTVCRYRLDGEREAPQEFASYGSTDQSSRGPRAQICRVGRQCSGHGPRHKTSQVLPYVPSPGRRMRPPAPSSGGEDTHSGRTPCARC